MSKDIDMSHHRPSAKNNNNKRVNIYCCKELNISTSLSRTKCFLIIFQGHLLSGPIQVKDSRGVPAKPGDLLVVEICNLGPLTANEWGVTATYERENGGGFLTDHSPCASKAIWHFEGIFAQSRHIPGVYFPGLIHPGLIGTAPSHELLDIWNERERDLVQQGEKAIATAAIIHIRPLTALPTSQNTLLGKIEAGTLLWEKIVQEAAGTVPARENGGNCDIKNLIKGSWV
ncbi:hypothetical protein KP509_14G080900 [Ceratopteris richardii]|uniref:Formamidase n=1 Tax=Ceratopteris richardii TaxID=49495 RepID=A0A8T2TDH6_CERRI|nr:hypothetical protein KP509_14G080900 [Ceratopteris richardii]